jgi:hypothetical protein
VSEVESWLSDTQDRVATAQRVLSEVERGLVAVEKVEAVVKRTRPVIRKATVVILGCLVGLGVVLLVSRRRHESQIEVPEGESSEDGA